MREAVSTVRHLAAVAVTEQLTQSLRTQTFASSFDSHTDALSKAIAFDASLCVHGGVHSRSDLSVEAMSMLVRWLDAGSDDSIVAVHESSKLPKR